jgi:hypothetical protein
VKSGIDVLDQAAWAQLAHGGALPGLLVGEAAGGEPQEMPVFRQHREQVFPFGVRHLACAHSLRLSCSGCPVPRSRYEPLRLDLDLNSRPGTAKLAPQ